MERGKNKVRNSNIELLRIIAIIMVLAMHYLNENMGGALANINRGQHNYYIINIIESYSIIAVNLFIIITGYFMTNSTKINFSKIIKIIGIAYFYRVILYLLTVGIGKNHFGYGEVIRAININLSGGYWYIKTYIILCLLAPFINIMLGHINEKDHRNLIVIIMVFFSIWPSFFSEPPRSDDGYGIITFVLMYILGSYIKKYNVKKEKWYIYLIGYIIFAGITSICSILKLAHHWNYNFIFNILATISLLKMFLNISINSKIINHIATFTLPIYIIHINKYVYQLIYQDILKCNLFYDSNFFIIHMIISIIVIFILCIIIEGIRRLLCKALNKISNNIFDDNNINIYKIEEI